MPPSSSIITPCFTKAIEALKQKRLPVAEVMDKVIGSVQSGNITILTAETGSGKTLLASATLADASDHPVVVLVPRRFLAIDAARNIARLNGTEVGKEVGYAIGRQAGDRAEFGPETRLIFATYGYALRSNLLNTAKTIICDEVHESGIDTSLARAILYRRLQTDPSLRVMEMSATLNAPKQAAYWDGVNDVTKTALLHAKGQPEPCECVHEPDKSLNLVVRDLITQKNRKGIAVFRSGVKEVEKTAEELRLLLESSGITNVEIAKIYGDMDTKERDEAVQPPQPGNIKILVGTNVIESGVNIEWLDAGVSDGMTKVAYYRENGADALVEEDLPLWRIYQQRGRVHRFGPGIFVLCAKKGMEKGDRVEESTPEISRVSLNGLVMHAAGYHINPLELHYDAPVDQTNLLRAREDLIRLGLMTPGESEWKLTPKGQFVNELPLGPEAGSMLWEAPKDILGDAIALAAIAEIRGLRADSRITHGQDKNSDMFDALKIFKKLGFEADEQQCAKANVGWKQYNDVKVSIEDIHRRLGTRRDMEFRTPADNELVQCLLKGSVNRLFDMRGGTFTNLVSGEDGFIRDKRSVTCNDTQDARPPRFAIAQLREFPNRDGAGVEVVAKNITQLSTDELCLFAGQNPDILTNISFERKKGGRDSFTTNYCGKTPITVGIPLNVSPGMATLIEPAYSQFCANSPTGKPPKGTGNTKAWEEQAARTEEKRRKKGGKG